MYINTYCGATRAFCKEARAVGVHRWALLSRSLWATEKNRPWSRERKQNTQKKMFPESRHMQGKMVRDSFMGDMNEGHYC